MHYLKGNVEILLFPALHQPK